MVNAQELSPTKDLKVSLYSQNGVFLVMDASVMLLFVEIVMQNPYSPNVWFGLQISDKISVLSFSCYILVLPFLQVAQGAALATLKGWLVWKSVTDPS